MKYFDGYDEIKVYPIPRGTEMSDQRIRDFFSQTELNPSSRPGLKTHRDYIGDSKLLERQMASPQPTKVIPQSTARVPPSDGRLESDRDLISSAQAAAQSICLEANLNASARAAAQSICLEAKLNDCCSDFDPSD
jgi:hypothetical protein